MSWSLLAGNDIGRRTLAVGAAGMLVGLVLVSGCSKSSSANHLSGQPMVPAEKSRELLLQAKEAVTGVQGVHLKGLMVVGGTAMTVDLAVAGAGASGTLEANGGMAEARVVNGRLYVKGDPTFWDAIQKGAGDGFSDSWVEASAKSGPQFAALLSLAPASAALDALAPTTDSWTDVPGRKLDGADTAAVRDLQPGRGNTVFISKGKPAYPLEIELGQGGLLTFSQWGKPGKAAVAPPEPVLDATQTKIHG